MLYKRIATMVRTAPLPPVPEGIVAPTWDTAAELARAWELKALAERLTQLAQAGA